MIRDSREPDPTVLLDAALSALELYGSRTVELAGRMALSDVQQNTIETSLTRLYALADNLHDAVTVNDDDTEIQSATDDTNDSTEWSEKPSGYIEESGAADWTGPDSAGQINSISTEPGSQTDNNTPYALENVATYEKTTVAKEEITDEQMDAVIAQCIQTTDRRSIAIGFVAWKVNPNGGLTPQDFARLRKRMDSHPELRIIQSDDSKSRYTVLCFKPKPKQEKVQNDTSDLDERLRKAGLGTASPFKPPQRNRRLA